MCYFSITWNLLWCGSGIGAETLRYNEAPVYYLSLVDSTSRNNKTLVFTQAKPNYFTVVLHWSDCILCFKVVVRGTVFARFSPEQKQQLIEALQDVG